MELNAGSNKSADLDRMDRLLATPSCRIPVGDLSKKDIETLKQRRRKSLEKYGYISNRES